MKKMKKSTLAVIVCVLVLAVGVAVFAILNTDDISLKQELEMNAEFMVKHEDSEYTITMQDMLDMKPVEFEAIMDTSTTDPTPVTFTGVELSTILASLDIDYSAAEVFEVRALDGYSSALVLDEVETPGNVYICLYMDGEALKTKSEGGRGPYMMVINSSEFSQRWCKFVQEIVIR